MIVIGFIAMSNIIKEKKVEIITQSTLKKIIDVSDMSTFEAVHNSTAKVMNKKKTENVDYYVSYKAKVKAGIDFDKIDIAVDNEAKIIMVTIPEIEINDVNVDIASLDYMLEKEGANTETVSEEAYKKCIEDVTNEIRTEDAIYERVKQNAENMIEALICPFVEQLDEEYQMVINEGGGVANEKDN